MTITPATFSTFSLVESPGDVLLEVFSYLGCSALGRIAQVCRRFREISECNDIWKPIHFAKWYFSLPWIGQEPNNWKAHARKVHRASQHAFFNPDCALVQHYDSEGSEGKLALLRFKDFLAFGLPNEAVNCIREYSEILSRKVSEVYSIVGEIKRASDINIGSKKCSNASKILCALEQDDVETARSYCSPSHLGLRKGSWICHIFQSMKIEMSESSKMSFSGADRVKSDAYSLAKAGAIIWLQRGLEEKAFASLEYVFKSSHSAIFLAQDTLVEHDLWFQGESADHVKERVDRKRKELSLFLEFFSEMLEEQNFALSSPLHVYDTLGELFKLSSFPNFSLLTDAIGKAIQKSSNIEEREALSARLTLLSKI